MHKVFWIGLVLYASGSTAFAANLVQVYQQAALNDAQYQADQEAYKAERQARPLALSNLLPQISLSGQVGRTHTAYRGLQLGGISFPNFSPTYNSNGYSITLTQTIFNYADWLGLKQAGESILSAQAVLEQSTQNLILQVTQAYMNVLRAEDTLRYRKAEAKALKQQWNEAKHRYKVGVASSTDVKQARASYDLSKAQIINAESKVSDAEQAMQVLTNSPVNQLAPVKKKFPLPLPQPFKVKKWVQMAEQQNLGLVAFRHKLHATRLNIRKATAGAYPTFALVLSRNHQYIAPKAIESGGTTDNSIALQMKVPLFTGDRISSQSQRAQYQYYQARDTLMEQQREIASQTRSDYLNLISIRSQIKALRSAVSSSEITVKAAEGGYRVGTRTIVDVITAIAGLYQARSELSSARYTYLIDSLKLKKDAGILTTHDLTAINRYLVRSSSES